ncbi:glycosyltransferase [Aurantimicrobium minutum]|uniref:D-inositol 3-phosphate glycosyltransferase n=2 Tax=Aurantimicrobium minutum TaxID=708131 RepID=A0A182C2P1_9MICO|nr:glycosyltransferase [Aurantimicrobium minutum]
MISDMSHMATEPLKIAVVFDCLFPAQTGGAERVYGRISELLVEKGHSVDYITRILNVPKDTHPFAVKGIWSGELYDNEGTRIPRNAFAFSWRVFWFFVKNRNKYDVVFLSSTPVLNLIAGSTALLGTKALVIADWLEVWTLSQWKKYSGFTMGAIAFGLQTFATRFGDIITVNSNFTARRLKKYRKSQRLIKLGLVDLNSHDDEDWEPHTPNKKYLLFVGRHIEDKQIKILIRAMDQPELIETNIDLYIVGTGPETEGLITESKKLSHPERVRFLGKVSDSELHKLMQSASVNVNPSKREGFGLVVSEAARWGTPSVVIDEPDNASKELIIPGKNGYVAQESRADSLASVIRKALDNEEELRNSTRLWFIDNSKSSGLHSSVNQILDLVNILRKP